MRPHSENPLRLLDPFSGIGGLSLGLERVGFQTVAFCEIEPFPRRVLAKHWPDVPIYDDVRELTRSRLAIDGISVDAICGGFPCQDISYAGFGEGLRGPRSGLWFEFARLIRELAPSIVIVENVAALLHRGMGEVLGTLSDIGYDAKWDVVSACSLGATHMRRRVFILAYPHGQHGRQRVRNTDARTKWPLSVGGGFESARTRARTRMADPSELYRGADGVPNGMDRNHAIGNAVPPDVAEFIGNVAMQCLRERVAA